MIWYWPNEQKIWGVGWGIDSTTDWLLPTARWFYP